MNIFLQLIRRFTSRSFARTLTRYSVEAPADLTLQDTLPPQSALQRPSQWGNLGYWSGVNLQGDASTKLEFRPYVQAATQLADELRQGIPLDQKRSLLVLGCGYGEEVRHWYLDHLAITAIDPSASAVHWARQSMSDVSWHQKTAEEYFQVFDEKKFECIFALDCAYHFTSKTETWKMAFERLHHKGVLALTDLVIKKAPSTFKAWLWFRVCSWLFSIPYGQWQTLDQYEAKLKSMGFSIRESRVISMEVLDGFCRYVRSPAFEEFDSYQGKMKSKVTAYLINKLRYYQLIDYVLVQAEKPESRK